MSAISASDFRTFETSILKSPFGSDDASSRLRFSASIPRANLETLVGYCPQKRRSNQNLPPERQQSFLGTHSLNLCLDLLLIGGLSRLQNNQKDIHICSLSSEDLLLGSKQSFWSVPLPDHSVIDHLVQRTESSRLIGIVFPGQNLLKWTELVP